MSLRNSSTALRFLGTRDTINGDASGSLVGVNTTILKTGSLVYVDSVKAYYTLQKDDTSTADGSSIIAPGNGPGRWFRQDGETEAWATQPEWFVDPVDGSDDSSGATSGQPIQTMAELTRRIGTAFLRQLTQIHLLGDVPREDAFVFIGVVTDRLRLLGEASTTLASGTFTSVSNLVPGTTRPSVTVAGFDWTPYVGKRVQITASATAAVGTIFFVEATVSGDVTSAYISTPYFQDIIASPIPLNTTETLSSGDSFIIEELTKIGSFFVDPSGHVESAPGTSFIQSIDLLNLSTAFDLTDFAAWALCPNQNITSFVCYGCSWTFSRVNCGFGTFVATGFDATVFITSPWSFVTNAVAFLNGVNLGGSGGIANIGNGTSVSNNSMVVVAPSGVRIQNSSGRGLRINDWGAISSFAFECFTGAFVALDGLLWGSSTVGGTAGIHVASGCVVSYVSARKPTVSGAAAFDVEIAGTTLVYAAIPTFDTTSGAGLVVFS